MSESHSSSIINQQTSHNETERLYEAPDFALHVERLESLAVGGIETPYGTESFQFRAGIEVEFALVDPADFRDTLTDYQIKQDASRVKSLESATTQQQREMVDQSYQDTVARTLNYNHGLIKNPNFLEGEARDVTDDVEMFKLDAIQVIGSLVPQTEDEAERQQSWLDQIDNFGVRELINFKLYEEFSRPTLAFNSPPEGATLDQLDAYTEQEGWLEFKFGTGSLQTGYYDNEGMCEIRTTPCEPSEALRRKKIIEDRMIELANDAGLLLRTSAESEHINLSVYKTDEGQGGIAIIGQDESNHARTLDITAGVSAAYSEGIWLHSDDMKWDYHFSRHGNDTLAVGPTRASLRVMDGRMELRAKFYDDAHALNWLMAGSIHGLERGSKAFEDDGTEIPTQQTVWKVNRTEAFDKHSDLQIQRAFENSEYSEDGVFLLNDGYNMIRGEEIAKNLIGQQEDMYGCDLLNKLIFSAIEVGPDGEPLLTKEALAVAWKDFKDEYKKYVEKFGITENNFDIAEGINERLKVVNLQRHKVVKGVASYKAESRELALAKIQNSSLASLALDTETDRYVSWLKQAA